MRRLVVLYIGYVAVAISARAQGASGPGKPFTATFKHQRTLTHSGFPARNQEVEEKVYRSSDGRMLQQLTVFENGRVLEYHGILHKADSDGKLYILDYQAHTVRTMPEAKRTEFSPQSDGSQIKQYENVGPFRCRVYPVVFDGHVVGHSDVSVDYQVVLKEDFTMPYEKGSMTEHTTLENLTPGEPPKRVFEIDPSYKSVGMTK